MSTRSAAAADEPAADENGGPEHGGAKVLASFAAGRLLATKAKDAGVTDVVFDRAGYRFQGRVKAFADGARAGGLRF